MVSCSRYHYPQRKVLIFAMVLGCSYSPVFGYSNGYSKQIRRVATTIHNSGTRLPATNEESGQNNQNDHREEEPNQGTSRNLVLNTALFSFGSVASSAAVGILPGLARPDGSFAPYTKDYLLQDSVCSISAAVLAFVFVKGISSLAASGVLESRDSRKIIHTLSAPLFVVLWPFFSVTYGARFFAAVIPVINACRLYIAGSGVSDEENELANAVSRSGDMKEALDGPFIYVIILLASVLVFWRDSLVGVIALSNMAAGDGMADIVGRRFGKGNKWFFSESKSVAGSLAFFIFSLVSSIALSTWLSYNGCLVIPFEMSQFVARTVCICAACALVELLPIGDDNWNVPLSAAFLSSVFLK